MMKFLIFTMFGMAVGVPLNHAQRGRNVSAPKAQLVEVDYARYSVDQFRMKCAEEGENIGVFDMWERCAAKAKKRSDCGKFMWSPSYHSWGCHCCATSAGTANNNYNMYAAEPTPTPPPTPPPTPASASASASASWEDGYISLGRGCISEYTRQGRMNSKECATRCNDIKCKIFSVSATSCYTTMTGKKRGSCSEDAYQRKAPTNAAPTPAPPTNAPTTAPTGPIYSYELKTSGECSIVVQSLSVCSAGGKALGLPVGKAVDDGGAWNNDPPGCYYEQGRLKFNNGANSGSCSNGDKCICIAE